MRFLNESKVVELRMELHTWMEGTELSNTVGHIDNMLMNHGEHKVKTIWEIIKRETEELEFSKRIKRKLQTYLLNNALASARLLTKYPIE